MAAVIWQQTTLTLSAKPRGFHLITGEVTAQLDLRSIKVGLLHLFIQHTSASLTLNENASPDVRRDFEQFFNALSPDGTPTFEHSYEGPDDMPAHIKASLLGNSLSLPVREGRLVLGTWQGVYLGEHRDRGGRRRLVATVHGEAA